MLTSHDFLQELDIETEPTRQALERVREQLLDWRPHDKSLSLGQLAMHVATLPGSLAEVAALDRFQTTGDAIPRPSATSTAELLAALDESVANAKRIVGSMDDAALAAPWSMVMGDQVLITIPRSTFIRRILFNHWYHHRGQLTVYLRQTGALVPAIYGPSADEFPTFG